ncbi:hypothetical protein JI664_11970 [Rhodobacter sp. NTK016B]|uniref:hypothetical protein n=1 Tax=Rhodobacter sp. NTK016B TaxID=2759676 RepID=UPI001A8F0142|nr:hypothetical protein [Rhodobacter sp. NTK016B]MBN8292682.1 hypothetical protein [Rhodobacter sp. NTK016B]
MTLFSLRGSTALVALSVSLSVGLPVMAPAQDSPTVQIQSEDWQQVTQFGFSFGLPPGLTQIRDLPEMVAYSDLDEDRESGILIDIQQFDEEQWEFVQDTGPEALTMILNAHHLVEVTPQDETIRAQGHDFAVFRGTGMLERPSGELVEHQVMFLVSMEQDIDGRALIIGVVGVGLGGEASGALQAEFIRALEGSEEATDTPDTQEDGALAPESEPDVIAMAEPAAPDVTMAEPQSDGVTLAEEATDSASAPATSAPANTPAQTASDAPETTEAAPENPALDAMLAAFAGMAEPSGRIPEGWAPQEIAGLGFAVPEGAEVLPTPPELEGLTAGFRIALDPPRSEGQIAVGLLPQSLFPVAPGDDGFVEAMAEQDNITAVESPRRVMLDGHEMMVIVGASESRTVLTLIDPEPDADGNLLFIDIQTTNTDPAMAQTFTADALASLAPAGAGDAATPEADPAMAALDAIVAEIEAMPDPDGSLPEGWNSYDRYGVRVALPDTAMILADRGPGERREFIARQPLPEAEGGSLEFAVLILSRDDVDAAPGDEGFLAMISSDRPERARESARRVMVGERLMRLYVVGGDPMPDTGDPASVEIYLTDLEPDAGGDFLVLGYRARLAPMDDVLATYGQYLQALAPETPEVEAEGTPEASAAMTAEAPSTEAPSTEAPATETASAESAEATPYGTPEGLTPEGWNRYDRFGLSIAMPPYAEIRNDEAEGPQRAINLYHNDSSARTRFEGGIAILPGAQVTARPGEEAFRAMLEGFAGVPVTDTGTTAMLGDRSFRLYTAEGMREFHSNIERNLMGFYLAGEPDADSGDLTLIGGSLRGYEPDIAQATMTGIIRSLSVAGEATGSAPTITATSPEAPMPQTAPAEDTALTTILTGVASMTLPDTLTITETREGDANVYMALAEAAAPDMPVVAIAAGILDRPLRRQVERMVHSVQAVVETEINGVPVWVLYGPSTRAMDARRTGPGEDLPARLVVPAVCTGAEPPYLVAMMSAPGDEALLDILQPALHLTVPPGATPCPPAMIEAIRGAAIAGPATGSPTGPATGPVTDPVTDPVTGPVTSPGVAVGEPHPQSSPSLAMAEAQAWEEAQRRGTPEAVLAFLAQYPRGLHSGEARGWLHARDIYAPDEYRPDPAALPEPPEAIRPPSDAEAWRIALADGRAQGLWTYLKAHPNGDHVAEAQLMLTEMLAPRGTTGGVVRDPARPPAPEAPRPDPGPMKR